MIPKVKTWVLTVECDGKLCRVEVDAPTRRLAVLTYRMDVSFADVILSVSLKKN